MLVNAARTLSELRHALAWPGTAPRELFGLLRNGFTAAAACVGIATADAMPLYRHDDPAESFRSLDSLLREILRGLLPETAAVVRFRADGEFLRAELPEGLGRTQALLVLQTEETVSSLLNEGRLVADAPDTLPPRWPRPSPESRCAKSLLRRACRNGMASTIWSPTPVRALAGGAAFRSPRRCFFPQCGPAYPVTFACFT
ncbi:MAG: type VI secretion system baseplate subunit TssK [Bilophila wadsworthia]